MEATPLIPVLRRQASQVYKASSKAVKNTYTEKFYHKRGRRREGGKEGGREGRKKRRKGVTYVCYYSCKLHFWKDEELVTCFYTE